MKTNLDWALARLNVDKSLLLLYVICYFAWGMGMNEFGAYCKIAKFTYWWQVITCYVFYMTPVSLLLRNRPFHAQYAYGLVAIGFLEFAGYALRTSYAYPGNIVEQVFSPQNFSLGMALFFALYFPIGNWGVGQLFTVLQRGRRSAAKT